MISLQHRLLNIIVGFLCILAIDAKSLLDGSEASSSSSSSSSKRSPRSPLALRSGSLSSDPDGVAYLAQFGYVDDVPGALRTQDEVTQALRNFQKIAGIPDTGVLDRDTREAMAKPRCGLPDTLALKAPENFELGPSSWKKNHITYSLVYNKLTHDLNREVIRRDINQAMATWEAVSALTFREERESPNTDIKITFDRYDHQDGFHFDGPGRVLAHAFPPGEGRGGDVHFDDDETWTSQAAEGTNLFTVAAHEIGHSLGIAHSQVKGALMYPWYQGYTPGNSEILQQDDKDAIIRLYGTKDRPIITESTTRPPVPVTPGTGTPGRVSPTPPSTGVSCENLNDVAVIRGELFAFKDTMFWRMNARGLITAYPVRIRDFWLGFPSTVQSIDAVFEREDNGKIIFFQGNRYYEFNANRIDSNFQTSGRSITDLGLPSSLAKVDSVFTWGFDKRIYVFSGHQYWRMRNERNGPLSVESGYPKNSQDFWKGVTFPIDAVLTQRNGETHFIKADQYWLLDDKSHTAADGFPQPSNKIWTHCPTSLRAGSGGVSSIHRYFHNYYYHLVSLAIFTHLFTRTLTYKITQFA